MEYNFKLVGEELCCRICNTRVSVRTDTGWILKSILRVMKAKVFAMNVWLNIVLKRIVLDVIGISIQIVRILKPKRFIWNVKGKINYESNIRIKKGKR